MKKAGACICVWVLGSVDGLRESEGSKDGWRNKGSRVKGEERHGGGKPYLSKDAPHHAPHGLALRPQQPIDILQVLQRLTQLWQIKQHQGKIR